MVQEVPGNWEREGTDPGMGTVLPCLQKDLKTAATGLVCVHVCHCGRALFRMWLYIADIVGGLYLEI